MRLVTMITPSKTVEYLLMAFMTLITQMSCLKQSNNYKNSRHINKHNKAFKSDSQRLAVSLRSSIAKRRSHLNAATWQIVLISAKYIGIEYGSS
ncbi:hypothetical protein C1O24_18690 [Vibrio diazotrophicus]|nr:hypothetical protein C1O24_18690 [Vibrio diazotrophicus]